MPPTPAVPESLLATIAPVFTPAGAVKVSLVLNGSSAPIEPAVTA